MTEQRLTIGADGFTLPLTLVTSTQAILARKRSGKSYCAAVQAEELLAAKQQVVALDPTGAWWGLRSSADGKGAGFAVAVFGGEHADAPLEPGAGAVMARAVVEHGFSCILDVGLMSVPEQVQFGTDFCSELLRLNRNAMHLFMDEAHTWCSQKPVTRGEKMALSAVSKLVLQGGIRGIGFTMISQRTSLVNKDVLSQVDVMTVLRMSHPLDLASVYDWVASEVNADFAKEMKAALPSLEVGTAYVCSATWGVGQKVQIRPRTTFNSGATPKPGERRVEPTVLAPVDLAALGEEIAASVKRAEEDSPEGLKAEVTRLRRLLEAKVPVLDEAAIENAVQAAVKDALAAQHSRYVDEWDAITQCAGEIISRSEGLIASGIDPDEGLAKIKKMLTEPMKRLPALDHSVDVREKVGKPVPDGITGPQMKVLEAVAALKAVGVDPAKRLHVAFFAGYSNERSGGFSVPTGQLVTAGLLESNAGTLTLTAAGQKVVKPQPAASTADLHAKLQALLSVPEWKLLSGLIHSYPKPVTREALARACGYSNVRSGGFSVPMGKLVSMGLATSPAPGTVVGTEMLFVKGKR